MTVHRAAATLFSAAVLVGACGGSTPGTPNPPTGAPTTAPTTAVVTATPIPTAAPDTAALLAAEYAKVTSGELRLDGTLRIGDVQATFVGVSKSNGPDESSTLTTTLGSQASTEQRVRVAGRRYVQRGGGPWLVDPSTGGGSGFSDLLKNALKAAVDLDAGVAGAANHRVEAADQPFDAVSAGFAKTATNGRATYTFLAKPDGTPVSVKLAATWTQPGQTGDVDAALDLTMAFTGLNTKPAVAAPSPVWQSFVSDRWDYSVAYPNDYDYDKDKDADYFIAPTYGAVSVGRGDADGYTLNQVATSELVLAKQLLKAKNGTNEAATLGGIKARAITVSGTNDGVKVIYFEVIAVHGKNVYAVVWFGEEGDNEAQRAVFSQMLSTFQFT
ncbi:MAG TPA: hypothetical protein VM451_09630 [Candidatus Limnocylindria bacterium]|nr:hypothetical protein [Candidatus Limnocylindria bacterium]